MCPFILYFYLLKFLRNALSQCGAQAQTVLNGLILLLREVSIPLCAYYWQISQIRFISEGKHFYNYRNQMFLDFCCSFNSNKRQRPDIIALQHFPILRSIFYDAASPSRRQCTAHAPTSDGVGARSAGRARTLRAATAAGASTGASSAASTNTGSSVAPPATAGSAASSTEIQRVQCVADGLRQACSVPRCTTVSPGVLRRVSAPSSVSSTSSPVTAREAGQQRGQPGVKGRTEDVVVQRRCSVLCVGVSV